MSSFQVIYIMLSLVVLLNFFQGNTHASYAQKTPSGEKQVVDHSIMKRHDPDFGTEEKSSQVPDRKLAREYIDEGFRASKSGDCNTAMKYFKKALELDPTWDKPHASIAEFYFKNGRTRDAILEMKKAIDIKRDDPAYFMRMGCFLIEIRDFKRAINILQRAGMLSSRMANVQFYLGIANFKMGEYEKAKRHLLHFIDMPQAKKIDILSANRILGVIFKNEGDLENAKSRFKKVLHDEATPEELKNNVRKEYDSVIRQIKIKNTKKVVGISSSILLVIVILLLFILLLMRRKASPEESIVHE